MTEARLTRRQYEVLRLTALGMRNKDIARRLGLSPETIRVHVHAACQRLDVNSRAEAWRVLGWLQVP